MSAIIETPDDDRFHQEDLQRIDWARLQITIGIIESRAHSGVPIHLERPVGWSKKAGVRLTMRNALTRQLDAILATAIIDEPDDQEVTKR